MKYVREYQTLREEIFRYQEHSLKALEYGVLITSGLLTFSYSNFVDPKIRWLSLFSPSIILSPFIYLQIQRIRSTWIIGRYIEFVIEPDLGFHWEGFTRSLREDSKKGIRPTFALSSAFPLLLIQIICPFLSFITTPTNFSIWVGLTIGIMIIVFIEFSMLRRSGPTPKMIEKIKKVSQNCIQRTKQSVASDNNEEKKN